MQETPTRKQIADTNAWIGCMMLICTLVTGFGIGLLTMFILFKLG